MSSLDDEDIPSLAFQKAEISASLNSTILQVFLMGIYTIVYGQTIFLYSMSTAKEVSGTKSSLLAVWRQASYRWAIVGVLSIMYVSSLACGALYWYQTAAAISGSANTLDAFYLIYDSPQWFYGVTDLCENIVMILADGLLMWRCYVIWNGSRRVIWAPCALWLAEAGLAIADAAIDFYDMDNFSDYQIFLTDTVSSAQFFTSAATSLVATYLIAHRIYAASQSSAVYTVCVILLGINNVVPPSDTDAGALMHDAATDYGGAIIWVIIGLTPTLMVMRVALSSNARETTFSSNLNMPSKIMFHSRGNDPRQSWTSDYSDKSFGDGDWKKGVRDLV